LRDLSELQLRPLRRIARALDEQNLRAFQEHFGIALPPRYVEFLRFCNGGRPRLCEFPRENAAAGEINTFFGLGTRAGDDAARAASSTAWDFENLWGETRARRSVLPNSVVPFGADDGGSVFYLDCVLGDAAPVMRLTGWTRAVDQIAPTFEALIDMLREPTDD
jgi:hypothetical protein